MKILIVYVTILLIIGTGWVKCVIHFVDCDFEPNYKAEVIYGVGTFVPPVGAVIGWMDLGK